MATTALVHQGDYILMHCFDGDCKVSANFDGEYGSYMAVGTTAAYTGPTVVVPNEHTQILETAKLVVPENITVLPIPSNWGRISWNGMYILVE